MRMIRSYLVTNRYGIRYKITLMTDESGGYSGKLIRRFYQQDLTEDMKWADLLAIRSCYKN